MAVKTEPHCIVKAADLGDWFARQGEEMWWVIDGDNYLMERIGSPCPGDILATTLRKLDRSLLIADPEKKGSGEAVTGQGIGDLAFIDRDGNRVFQLSWDQPDAGDTWLIYEDKETAELAAKAWKEEGQGHADSPN